MPDTTFRGCMPALMTPCDEQRRPDFGALVRKGQDLIEAGMSAVVYCGSMGDWPLLTDEDRQEGVARLAAAGIPTVVGTGAANTRAAVAHAAHAARVGARGLMLIPRVLSRRSSEAAQEAHFKAILDAAPALPAVIYNSPYYGFVTRAGLFFRLREAHPNLVGFKEFSGAADLTYAAEHITSGIDELTLMVGVDTTVFHGYVNCGATGAITGIGNALPKEVLHLVSLCEAAANGDPRARRKAKELEGCGPTFLALAVFGSIVLEGAPDNGRMNRSAARFQATGRSAKHDTGRGEPRASASGRGGVSGGAGGRRGGGSSAGGLRARRRVHAVLAGGRRGAEPRHHGGRAASGGLQAGRRAASGAAGGRFGGVRAAASEACGGPCGGRSRP